MNQRFVPWKPIFLLITATIGLSACEKETIDGEYTNPVLIGQQYDSSGFVYNSDIVAPLADQLDRLTAEMQRGRNRGEFVSEETLRSLFSEGGLSLETVTTPYYTSRLTADNGYFAELSKAAGGNFFPFDRSREGGVYGNYLFDEYGVEMEQLIEKGLYTAALYNYATSLTNGTLRAPNADQLLFLYGANPEFVNSDNPALHRSPDRRLAGYAAQRDKGDNTGFYFQNREAFISLQTALNRGEKYAQQRDEAVTTIKQNWEKASAATVIHQLHRVIGFLENGTTSDTARSEALHLLSEAAGLLHGWRMIDAKNRTITDAQIDEVLALMNIPYDQAASAYRFVTHSSEDLPKLTQAIGRIQAVYGFSPQDVEDFRRNWVAEQNR
ncbi:hypothetical protein [Larkinella soli]|uniref:hypothetical protein n=1 Tax=Larkinella soli TaxID=1770527 RepID=UPI000FFC2555|nr:hypothetical protein [Larkinella soli]